MKALIAEVEEGGFAAAARKLQLSRSRVNKFVINLENNLGVPLFYRTARKVTPMRGVELRALRQLQREYPDTNYLFVSES